MQVRIMARHLPKLDTLMIATALLALWNGPAKRRYLRQCPWLNLAFRLIFV